LKKNYIIEVFDIDKHPAHFDKLLKLWRKYSGTLGFFPEGAFREHAVKKQILIAVDREKNFAGYILYRISKQKVSITHLCVDELYRKCGISRHLVECLQKETNSLKGIGLYCRRDYAVSKLWPKLGFIPIDEKIGRGNDQETLTYWWRDNRNPTLFTESIKEELKNNISVVVDANVFYDLDPKNNKEESIESKSLGADWFTGEVRLYVTDEIYTEINRRNNDKERKYQRNRVNSFKILESDKDIVILLEQKLPELLRRPRKVQDQSDIRQLAHAIASKADYFITRDEYLLKQAEAIYEKYGLNIMRPADIILEIDNLYDEVSYRPARLAGTLSSLRLVASGEVNNLVDQFCLHEKREHKRYLKDKLAKIIAYPDKSRVYLAEKHRGNVIAIIAISSMGSDRLLIPLARIDKGRLGPTLARYLLMKVIRDAAAEGMHSVVFSDDCVHREMEDALSETGFLKSGKVWVRFILKGFMELASFQTAIESKSLPALVDVKEDCIKRLIGEIEKTNADKGRHTSCELERLIWPGKIHNDNIPCFIVPIQPGWARGLFDEKLAGADLFGADLTLALQNEGVYYRSPIGRKISAPARILWYVSDNKNIPGSSAIRACSVLRDVSIDKPKPLYKKYRRLGVYDWVDVFSTAKNDHDKNVMALHFSHTELFHKPIEWKRIQKIIKDLNVNKTLVSATHVPADIFLNMYELGMNNAQPISQS